MIHSATNRPAYEASSDRNSETTKPFFTFEHIVRNVLFYMNICLKCEENALNVRKVS